MKKSKATLMTPWRGTKKRRRLAKNTEPLVFHETVEKDHGRLEVRRYWQRGELGWFAGRGEWEGLRSVGVVEGVRQVGEGRPGIERRYYLGSLGVDVERFARAVRGQRAIENSAAPGARRAMRGGSEPGAHRTRGREPGDAAAAGAQPPQTGPHEKAPHQRQATQRLLAF